MIKEAIEYIVSMGPANQHVINGAPYSDKPLQRIKGPSFNTLQVKTISALCQYVKNNPEEIDLKDTFVLVEDLNSVSFLGASKQGLRPVYCTAHYKPSSFDFSGRYNQQKFVTEVMAYFVGTPGRKKLLEYVGTTRYTEESDFMDDGVCQAATIQKTVNRDLVKFWNPVELCMSKTFPEIELIQEKMNLRMKVVKGSGEKILTFSLNPEPSPMLEKLYCERIDEFLQLQIGTLVPVLY